MQQLNAIFLTKVIILFSLFLQSIHCQANDLQLAKGDSLFNSKDYQEALLVYESILDVDQSFSPAMLLKMAFISEGMGDYSKAILYLSIYNENDPNPQVPAKIKELTNQGALTGYSISDSEHFLGILRDNRQLITSTLALLLIISLILLVIKGFQPGYYATSLVLVGIVFISNNYLQKPQAAVVTGDVSLVMAQPSSGGDLVRKVGPGHRVVIKSSVDIWYEIEWGEKLAYIRKNQVAKI